MRAPCLAECLQVAGGDDVGLVREELLNQDTVDLGVRAESGRSHQRPRASGSGKRANITESIRLLTPRLLALTMVEIPDISDHFALEQKSVNVHMCAFTCERSHVQRPRCHQG